MAGSSLLLWGQVSLVGRALDCHAGKMDSFPSQARHFIMLASSVYRDVTGGPVGRK